MGAERQPAFGVPAAVRHDLKAMEHVAERVAHEHLDPAVEVARGDDLRDPCATHRLPAFGVPPAAGRDLVATEQRGRVVAADREHAQASVEVALGGELHERHLRRLTEVLVGRERRAKWRGLNARVDLASGREREHPDARAAIERLLGLIEIELLAGIEAAGEHEENCECFLHRTGASATRRPRVTSRLDRSRCCARDNEGSPDLGHASSRTNEATTFARRRADRTEGRDRRRGSVRAASAG